MRAELTSPTLGFIELESLARGLVVADSLLKRAQVAILLSEAVSPGKYVLLFSGQLALVEEAFAAGLAVGGSIVIDSLILPQVAPQLDSGLRGQFKQPAIDASLGIVETHTVASCLAALDAALKRVAVGLSKLQLARGIGGKGWFVICGELADVEAALEAAAAAVSPHLLVATELIARPAADLTISSS